MKLVSFDIGIRNLAYCVLERNLEETEILHWGVIDLIDKVEPPCIYLLPTQELCGKPSFYSFKQKKEMKYVCKAHKKSISKELKPEKIKQTNANKVAVQIIGKRIVIELDKRPFLTDVDLVLLENQPVLKNPKMKFVQSFIFGYFTVRGVNDTQRIKDIKLISARNKLSAYDGHVDIKSSSITYGEKKKLAIKYCRLMIEDKPSFLEIFDKSKKKDDLSDSFLQGMYYLKKNKN